MSSDGSVTMWIDQVRSGRPEAAQKLWERYFERLVRMARKRLGTYPRRAADEEDVALSAFDSFCRAAERGRFPRLLNRDDIWQVLVVIAARKVADLVQHENRRKRGGGRVLGESALLQWADGLGDGAGLERFMGDEPGPDMVAAFADECRNLLDGLEDDVLRQVAVLWMENLSAEEISARLGCSKRTVERKVQRILAEWRKAAGLLHPSS